MNKVNLYIRRKRKHNTANRYYPFEELASVLGSNRSYEVECPFCHEKIGKEDWDNIDMLEIKCFYCFETLVEI